MGWMARYFELSRSSDGHNVRPMEGMRGFAVFLVFLVHYATLMSPLAKKGTDFAAILEWVHSLGNAGVDLFFVLSGYLIYGSLISRPQSFLKFIRRRVARIYPAFCVVFAIYIALSLANPALSKFPKEAAAAWLYFFQNFLLLPGLFPIEPMITVAWSLSYEMFYYLVIPLIVALFGMRKRSTKWRVSFFIGAAVAIALYCLANGGHIRLAMFISGVLLYEALQDRSLSPAGSATALVALVAGLIATTIPMSGAAGAVIKTAILFSTFFVLCYSCFSQPRAWLSRGFSWTPLRWLGNMSYSYYLLHGLALKIAITALLPAAGSVRHEALFVAGMLPIMFVVTLLPTAALFLFVERPMSLATPPRRPAGAVPPQGVPGALS
jgi:peptidoglycan/LPS O-acetylase OafA/YrhL